MALERYGTIVVDPPWPYKDTGGQHGIGKHYEGLSLADLAGYPIGAWALEQSHLYLWTTNGFMEQAHILARHWGFEQKTILTWVKPGMGMGRYFRNSTEHVLFCAKGKLPLLRKDALSYFKGAAGRHSEKPSAFYDLVETCSPGPRLDVFARKHRFGWDTFGNEVYNLPTILATLTDTQRRGLQ